MTSARVNKNRLALTISMLMLVFFAVMLYIYNKELSYEYVAPYKPVVSTTTPVNPPTSGTKPSSTSTMPVVKPVSIGQAMGIAAGSKLNGLSDTVLDRELKGMVDLGIEWVRFDIEWGFVQYGSADKYDWARYDKIINALVAHNLKILPILTYTPEWARVPGCRGGSHCPPKDPATFAKFASEAVNRYKSKGVHYWEIWNEPNSYDFWATKADCKAYTDLLKATYPAIKKADPRAFVITGGLAQVSTTDVNISALEFIQCIYDNGGKNFFDAVGDHPYTFPQLPSDNNDNAWGRMSLTSPSFRSIMVANGDGHKKIWMTEYGAPTNGPDPKWFISEIKQAQMVEDTIKLYKKYDWAGPLFWYTYIDSGTQPTSNECCFGFVRQDWSLKPAFYTLKELISKGI